MPIFYFDVTDGQRSIPDEEGRWFADVEAAQKAAVRELASTIAHTGIKTLRLTIRNESGSTLAEAEAELRIEVRPRDRHT